MAKAKEISKISDLVPDANNYNKGTEFGSGLIAKSIQKNGLGRSILIDRKGGVIAGNKTLEAAVAAGFDESKIRVIQTDGTELIVVQRTDLDLDTKRGKEMALADNATAKANLAWDYEAMSADFESVELEAWGVFADESEGSFGDNSLNSEAQEDDFEVPEVETVKTDIVLGDLFEIGPHRLLCGDSTIKQDVLRLMNGEKAELCFTDPPYGVNVKGGKGKSNISGDLTQTAIPFSFEIAVQYATKDVATFYFCGAEGNISLYHKLFERFLAQMPRMLIWVKNGFVLKPNGYHNQYELIFHGYKAGAGGLSHWFAGRTEHEASDVWRINRDASSTYEHPTQKPIELPSRAIRNSTKEGWLLFEPFSGSGSTMIAAHQLNRRCFAMELDPQYVQVTLDRMLKLDPTIEVKKNGRPYKRMEQ